MHRLSFLPTRGFQKVRCTAVMEKEVFDATINCRTVTQQIEEGTPWVVAISANTDIARKEPIATDLTLKQVTTGQIQQAQREDPIISKVTLYKHQRYLPKHTNLTSRSNTLSCYMGKWNNLRNFADRTLLQKTRNRTQ